MKVEEFGMVINGDNLFCSMLANLLQCDVMFQLMTTVMRRACDLKAGLFSESHLQKVGDKKDSCVGEEVATFLYFSLSLRSST